MPSAGSEPTIPTSELPQTYEYVFECAAGDIGVLTD